MVRPVDGGDLGPESEYVRGEPGVIPDAHATALAACDFDVPRNEAEVVWGDMSPEWPPWVNTEQVEEFIQGTLKNAVTDFAQFLADAHGLFGPALRLARLVVTAVESLQAADGKRGVEVDVPVFVTSWAEVDMNVHLGSGEGPSVSYCCALAGDSPLGDLKFDGVVVGPGDNLKDQQPGKRDHTHQESVQNSVEPISLSMRRQPNTVSETVDLVQDCVTSKLLRRNKRRQVAVWYSISEFAAILFYEIGQTSPSWRVGVWEADVARLGIYVEKTGP
jgi:hypothetical protein